MFNTRALSLYRSLISVLYGLLYMKDTIIIHDYSTEAVLFLYYL